MGPPRLCTACYPTTSSRCRGSPRDKRPAGVRPWLELMRAPGFDRLAAALREAGAHPVDFLGVFGRDLPAPPSPPARGIRILQPPPDPEEFSGVLLTGHGLREDQLPEALPRNLPMGLVEGATLCT